MTIYRSEQIKPEVQGEFGLAICKDNSGRFWTFVGGLTDPLSKRYEEFRSARLELVNAYDGIKLELAFELASKDRELNEGRVGISNLDKILLKDTTD